MTKDFLTLSRSVVSYDIILLKLVHGPQMAKKIALWISILFHPITRSPSIGKSERKKSVTADAYGFRWSSSSEQESNTLVNVSPDIGKVPARKQSLGGGVIVREQLIRDLE